MANISVTHTFSNSTTADATEVNQNFTDIINGTSDGTKDFSINALTCAGAATLNGNVTLGNASSDDVTVTGSLASSIPIKTTFSYDIGSATLGLRSLYLGSDDSGAFSVRLIAGTMGASYTTTLPTAAGTIGQFLVDSDGSATLAYRYPEKTTSKTTTYTATGDETTVLADTSGGAWALTLPAAASFTGKHYYVKKTTSDFNALTIDGNASETIDGSTTTTVNTQYESLKIVSDGSNWHILERSIPSAWESFTPTGAWSTNVTWSGYKRRNGDMLECMTLVVLSSTESGTLEVDIPNSLTIDTGKLFSTAAQSPIKDSVFMGFDASASNRYMGYIVYSTTTTVRVRFWLDNGTGVTDSNNVTSAAPVTWNNTDRLYMYFSVPISGWKA